MIRPRRQDVVDGAVALVAFALTLGVLVGGGGEWETEARDGDWLGVVLAALASLPLVARRRSPLGVFALTALASAVMSGLDYPHGPPIGPTVALFFLARAPDEARAPLWLTAVTVAGLFGIHVTATGLAADEFPTVPLLLGVLVWGGAWVVGDRVRHRRERILELEERAPSRARRRARAPPRGRRGAHAHRT